MSEAIIFHCDVEICGSKIKKGTFVRQNEWVGLTDEEVQSVIRAGKYESMEEFASDIEAKLKEKNT